MSDDAFHESWSPGDTRTLDERAVDRVRLPGGITREEILELQLQTSSTAATDLQSRVSEAEWAKLSSLAERYWATEGPPVTVKRYRSRRRPDVAARFAAQVVAGVGSWLVSGYLVKSDAGEIVVDQLTIEPELDGQGGLTPEVLRAVSVPEIVARVRGFARLMPELASLAGEIGAAVVAAGEAERSAAAVDAAGGLARAGRFPAALYRWVAIQYVDMYEAGTTSGITAELAAMATARFGRPVTRPQMRDWIRRARELGYLEGGDRGRLGARLGAAAHTREEQ